MKKSLILVAAAAISGQVFADATCGAPQAKAGAACAASQPKTQTADAWSFLPEVVATVDGQKVTKSEVVKAVTAQLSQFTNQGIPLEQLLSQFPKQMLNNYITRAINNRVERLLLLEIAKKDGIVPSTNLEAQAVAIFSKQMDKQMEMFNKLPDEQRKKIEENVKAQTGMTIAQAMEKQRASMIKEVKERIKDPDYQKTVAVQIWVDKNIVSKIKVDDKEVKEFYTENKKRFTQPETVTASHILIIPEGADPRSGKKATPEAKAKAKLKIEGILKQLKAGADFGELAEKMSDCPSSKNKGALGKPFKHGEMDPAFEKAAFALKKGEMSGIVESSFGYHIIKVTDKTAAKVATFDEVKDSIKMQLEGKKINEAIQAAVNAQREKANVVINYKPETGAPQPKK